VSSWAARLWRGGGKTGRHQVLQPGILRDDGRESRGGLTQLRQNSATAAMGHLGVAIEGASETRQSRKCCRGASATIGEEGAWIHPFAAGD